MAIDLNQLIITLILVFVITMVLGAALIKLVFKGVHSEKDDFKKVLITSLVCTIFAFLPIIGLLLGALIITKRHDTGYLAGIFVFLFSSLVALVLSAVGVFYLMDLAFSMGYVAYLLPYAVSIIQFNITLIFITSLGLVFLVFFFMTEALISDVGKKDE